MASGQHLFEVGQIAHHGDDVILDVAEIKADITTRSNTVLLIAALREALDNICLAAEEAHHGHDFLATFSNGAENDARVLGTRSEHLIFDGIGFVLNVANNGAEGVNNVVTRGGRISKIQMIIAIWEGLHKGIANPVSAEGDVILKTADSLSDVGSMWIRGESESQQALTEDYGVDVDRFHELFALVVHLVE